MAGTPVLTAAGYKPIEQVSLDDVVWSKSDETGEEGWKRVVWVKPPADSEILSLELLDGDLHASDTLQVTPNHPFWVAERGWVKAGALVPGDQVLAAHGGWLRVGSSTWAQESATVYNFEVEEFHTYFFGETGAWVHNNCGEPVITRFSAGRSPSALFDNATGAVVSQGIIAGPGDHWVQVTSWAAEGITALLTWPEGNLRG